MYDIRSAMLNIGIVFTPGKFKINLEKTWKTPGILVNLRSTDPVNGIFDFREGRVLGCDTQIVCVDETPCSIMDGLIVCVDVEKDRGENTTLG